MSEKERDDLLHDAEVLCLKKKIDIKGEKTKKLYGVLSVAIHKDRTFLVNKIDKETMTGICSCGRVVDICDEPIYCRYCGQRTSGKFGWKVEDYYNERS